MTTLLTIAILLLVSIAVWQITKIFQVAQLNQKVDDSQVANDKDNDWNGKLMFAFLAFIYLITIYSFWAWGDVLLPESASEHGKDYDRLMWISIWHFCWTYRSPWQMSVPGSSKLSRAL